MSTDWNVEEELKPLELKCTSSDCEKELHCFKQSRKMKAANQSGQCRDCGAKLVDWERVHKRDLSDAEYTFEVLKKEFFRHHMWHVEISQKAVNHARKIGKNKMPTTVEKRIRKSVGSANPPYDGRQTPKENSDIANAIHYAQHATACCCRKCIEYWHNIPIGQALTEEQIRYFTNLVMLYIEKRLPYLTENGEKIPPIRKKTPKKPSTKDEEG